MIAKRLTCLLLFSLSACSTTEEQVIDLLDAVVELRKSTNIHTGRMDKSNIRRKCLQLLILDTTFPEGAHFLGRCGHTHQRK